MTSEEFWYSDPELFNCYRTSFINKEKRKVEYDNYTSWLSGLYIHNGETILNERLIISISKMMGDKTSKISNATYPTQPYNLNKQNNEKVKTQDEIVKESKYNNYQNSLKYHATIKQRYLEKMKTKTKGE